MSDVKKSMTPQDAQAFLSGIKIFGQFLLKISISDEDLMDIAGKTNKEKVWVKN
ncbi:MAG: hypothetical protein KDK99_17350 [Verrucomicrobiales bacterium]|nr:hypothetical protein [Verrucomicrobiales bacterium]